MYIISIEMVSFARILLIRVQIWANSGWKIFSFMMTLYVICLFLVNNLRKRIKEGSSTGETEVFDLGMGDFNRFEAYKMLSKFLL